ncbi:MAG: BON domain-containing protein [Burkholderiales bacterium]
MTSLPSRPVATWLCAAVLATLTAGCAAPLLLGGAAFGGAAMVASDRRTAATQIEDQSIEFKANNRVRDALGDKQHVSATSYNRLVLLTGEVHTDADRTAVEQTVAKVENVKNVVNELVVGWPSSMSARSSDLVLAGKVKATFIDAKALPANAFKVVVERSVVYLLGRVTEAEATRAVDLTRTISGVQKVVRLLDVVTEAELQETKPK